nr:hypothetical protein [Methanobrevibacter smithii]
MEEIIKNITTICQLASPYILSLVIAIIGGIIASIFTYKLNNRDILKEKHNNKNLIKKEVIIYFKFLKKFKKDYKNKLKNCQIKNERIEKFNVISSTNNKWDKLTPKLSFTFNEKELNILNNFYYEYSEIISYIEVLNNILHYATMFPNPRSTLLFHKHHYYYSKEKFEEIYQQGNWIIELIDMILKNEEMIMKIFK